MRVKYNKGNQRKGKRTMAKILKDKELGEIICKATCRNDESFVSADAYEHFLEDLADLVCDYFGGRRGSVGRPDDSMKWTVAIRFDECVPSDGGVFKDYDKDVTWKDGTEQ
jgi:hypothetical protein